MLEQARIMPGMRVLEIGSGGYNAALIAELVGPAGEVTSLDIDPAVIDRARRLLDAAGYQRVRTVVGDGAAGWAEHAPFDRIVVTVEAADLAAAWVEQLTGDGRLVAPVRLRGVTRSLGFARQDGHLVAQDLQVCGFVPMRGARERRETLISLHHDGEAQVGLRLDDPAASSDSAAADVAALRGALAGSRVEVWSGVVMRRGESFEDLELWLVTMLPRFAQLAGTRQGREQGIVASWSPAGTAAALSEDGGSFAYLAIRPVDQERTRFELGAIAHGATAGDLAERFAGEITRWEQIGRDRSPVIHAYPTTARPDASTLTGIRVIEGPEVCLTITWPPSF